MHFTLKVSLSTLQHCAAAIVSNLSFFDKRPFDNYVDKMRGSKMSVSVHAGGGGSNSGKILTT